MLKVLFISFEFHPVQTTGNFRAAKFVKYLREFGIEPIVLCGEEQSILQYYKGGKNNPDLNKEIPEDVLVYRVAFKKKYAPASKYTQFFYYADPIARFWKSNALKKAKSILEEHKDIKAIFVTLPPFSVNEIAYELSKKYNLPLIVDLRDAWSKQGQFPYFTRAHFWVNKFFEKRLLKRAHLILTVTKGLEEIYLTANPRIAKNKFEIIYNSFDNYQFDSDDDYTVESVKQLPQFIIGYIGAFYYDTAYDIIRKTPWMKRKGTQKLFYFSAEEEWIYRSPYFFFKALSGVFERRPELKKKIFFGHIGGLPQWAKDMAGDFNLNDNIIDYGFVKSNELGLVVKDFGALLITTEKLPNNKSFCLPSKTFDYVKHKKPILSFVKDGDLKDFLEHSDIAYIIDPDSINASEKLEQFLENGFSSHPNVSYVSTFDSKYQAKKLAELISAQI